MSNRYCMKGLFGLINIAFMALAIAVAVCPLAAYAASISVVPSSSNVTPGESFYIDIEVDGIPEKGLGAIQFKLNVEALGATVSGVRDLSQSKTEEVSVVTPLIMSSFVEGRSGLQDFFINGEGSHGVLVMDNHALLNGTALYTFGHTSGANPSVGGGKVARFYLKAGDSTPAEKVVVILTEVMLLDSGELYPLDSNIGAEIALKCTATVPDLIGLGLEQALQALEASNLVAGATFELDNYDGAHALGVVLEQSALPGEQIQCDTSINLAINYAPGGITGLSYADKTGDELGTVVLSWAGPGSADTQGYRIYNGAAGGTLLAESSSLGPDAIEIDGLPNNTPTTITVTALDSYGNESTGVSLDVLPVDDVAPRVSIQGVSDGMYYPGSVMPAVNVEDAAEVTIDASINGASYDFSPIASDGQYILAVSATDEAGNVSTYQWNFVIDTVAPEILLSGAEDGEYYNFDVAPLVTIWDTAFANSTILLNGIEFVNGTLVSDEGMHELSVTAYDQAGNMSSEIYVIYIDKAAPQSLISIGRPSFDDGTTVFVGRSAEFLINSTDPGQYPSGMAGIDYTIDNGDWNEYSDSITLDGLHEGDIEIAFRARDLAGNIAEPQRISVVLDIASPETVASLGIPMYINEVGAAFITSQSQVVLNSTDSYSGVWGTEYRVDSSPWTPYEAFSLTGEGAHALEFRSYDNVSNQEPINALQLTVDDSPPVTEMDLTGPYMIADDGTLYVTYDTLFTLVSEDNLSGVDYIEYKVNDGLWNYYEPFHVDIIDLNTVSYRSADYLGNVEDAITLGAKADNTAPISSITVDEPRYIDSNGKIYATDHSTLKITAEDSGSGVSLTEYRVDQGQWLEYAPFALEDEGEHRVEYRSTDSLGNVEVLNAMELLIDNTPPETHISVDGMKYVSDSGDIYVSTASLFVLNSMDTLSGVSTIEYSLDGGQWTAYTPFSLEDDGTHYIYYRAMDNLGNMETEKVYEVNVDAVPPSVSFILNGPVYRGNALFITGMTGIIVNSIDEISGVSLDEYRVDEGEWAEYSEPLFLATEGAHIVAARATDNIGNMSQEKSISVVVDNTPPHSSIAVNGPSYESDALYVKSTTHFSITSTDALSGVAAVRYSIDGGGWQQYTGSFSVSGDGLHEVVYRAVDNMGNAEPEKTLSIVVDDQPPTTSVRFNGPIWESDGVVYTSKDTSVELLSADIHSGVKETLYSIDGGAWTVYKVAIGFGDLDEGGHAIEYYSTDNLDNMSQKASVSVVVDNTPPHSSLLINGPSYESDTLYVKSSTKFSIMSTDALSGVAAVRYRLDGDEWQEYTGSFSVSGDGPHEIVYGAVDNIGNVENDKKLSIIVDDTPPATTVRFDGVLKDEGGVIYGNKDTSIVLYSTDTHSGVKETRFRIDSGAWSVYSASITLEALEPGRHVIEYYGLDNLDNVEDVGSAEFVKVDLQVEVSILSVPRVLVWTDALSMDAAHNVLSSTLNGKDAYYSIVTDKDAFVAAFRSGVYNEMIILDTKEPLNANVLRELRDSVERGTGIMVSAWKHSVHPIMSDVFGVKSVGSKPMDTETHTLTVFDSLISNAATSQTYGRVLKSQLTGGTLAAEARRTAGKKGHKQQLPVPAIVYNEYGNGRAVFYAYDILETAASGDATIHTGLLDSSIGYMVPEEAWANAYTTVLLETTISLQGADMDIRAVETLSDGFEYLPAFDLQYTALEFEASLKDGQLTAYRYFARLPDRTGLHTKTTDVYFGGTGQTPSIGSFDHVFAVSDNSATLLDKALTLLMSSTAGSTEGAATLFGIKLNVDSLRAISLDTLEGAEEAISISVSSIEKARKLGPDAVELIGILEEYLRIAEVYYSVLSGVAAFEGAGGIVNNSSAANPSTSVISIGSPAGTGPSASQQVTAAMYVVDYPRVLVWANDGCASGLNSGDCISREEVALRLASTVHYIVNAPDAFASELRSDYFTDYIVLGDAESLAPDTLSELRERIYAGRGLVGYLWTGGMDVEVFGISLSAAESRFEQMIINTPDGSIISLMGMSPAMAIQPMFGTDVIGTSGTEVVATASAYGEGTTIYIGYELGLDAPTGVSEDVLESTIYWAHGPMDTQGFAPRSIVPVEVGVTAAEGADIVAECSYPMEMVVIDETRGMSVVENPASFDMTIGKGGSAAVGLLALLPDTVGRNTMTVTAGGSSASLDLPVTKDSRAMADGILAALDALSTKGSDKAMVKDASRLISGVRSRAITDLADAEANISDILDAIESIRRVASADTSGIRHEMSLLLVVWQQQWYGMNIGN